MQANVHSHNRSALDGGGTPVGGTSCPLHCRKHISNHPCTLCRKHLVCIIAPYLDATRQQALFGEHTQVWTVTPQKYSIQVTKDHSGFLCQTTCAPLYVCRQQGENEPSQVKAESYEEASYLPNNQGIASTKNRHPCHTILVVINCLAYYTKGNYI